MIGAQRATDALPAPLKSPRRSGRRPALTALTALTATLLLGALAAPPAARAFLPGSLSRGESDRLALAGLGGVPTPRALRLPEGTTTVPVEWHLLVVLVDFPDRAGDRNAGGPAAWHRATFGAADQRRSLADYYRENSGGRLVITGTTTSWIRADSTYAYYVSAGAGNLGGGVDPAAYPHNSQRLVEEIVGKLGARYDWSRYDNNGDGLVDGLLIVAAGDGADETAPLDLPANRARLLAHQFHTTMEVAVSGARVFDYAIVAANARLGVVAHEVGHLFGLIDLYQAGGFAGPNGPFGLGDWSLMATGALLDGGRAPCHLDAWSKARLGFTHPTRLDTPGAGTFRLPAASDSAAVLRLWGLPGENEYYLAEARFRRGFDAALPAEGLLVYHVIESVQTNSSPARYRVALVQADGRDDLASLDGNRGDAGDPFAATVGVVDSLTAGSDPPSVAYDGGYPGVALRHLSRGAARVEGEFTLERPRPLPRIVLASPREVTGDGDGALEAGEQGALDLVVTNFGATVPLSDLRFNLISVADPLVVPTTSGAAIGALPATALRTLNDAVRFSVAGGFPAAGREVRFVTDLAHDNCLECENPTVHDLDTLVVYLGPAAAPQDDFESGAPGWSHATGRPSAPDRWHLGALSAHSGSTAWFMGRDNGALYDPVLDDRLVSPPYRVPADGRLVFWQKIEAESLASNRAWDGGRVEIETGDRHWRPLEPIGGYPFRVEAGSGNPLFGAGVFSGRRDWHPVVCDLSPWAGRLVRFRFRFTSDFFGMAPEGASHSGWFIDDVRVAAAPPAPTLSAALASPGRVQLAWEAPSLDATARWRLTRRVDRVGAIGRTVGDYPASAGPSFQVTDEPTPGTYLYGLTRWTGDGPEAESSSLPVTVLLPGATVTLAPPYPNPYRPTGPPLSLEIVVPAEAAEREGELEIVDIAGRLVTRLPFVGQAGQARRLAWDGRAAQGPLRAGVYFVRLVLRRVGGGNLYGTVHRLVVVS